METFNLRRYALGICAAVAVLSGCGGSQSPSMLLAPAQALAQPQGNSVTPMYIRPSGCDVGLRVHPKYSTIRVNQKITIRDMFVRDIFGNCAHYRVGASWSSNGGSLRVIHGGTAATFSASSPGVYTVTATYYNIVNATVNVTSP
jgi:hypothetical protein